MVQVGCCSACPAGRFPTSQMHSHDPRVASHPFWFTCLSLSMNVNNVNIPKHDRFDRVLVGLTHPTLV